MDSTLKKIKRDSELEDDVFHSTPSSNYPHHLEDFQLSLRKNRSFSLSSCHGYRYSPSFSTPTSSSSSSSFFQSYDRFIPNRKFSDISLSNVLVSTSVSSNHLFGVSGELGVEEIGSPPFFIFPNDPTTQASQTPHPSFETFKDSNYYYSWSERAKDKKKYKEKLLKIFLKKHQKTPSVLNLTNKEKNLNSQWSLSKPPSRQLERKNYPQPKPIVKRHIPKFPLRVLEMPAILDDFGGNVMDWNKKEGFMTIGLRKRVFMWHSEEKTSILIPIGVHEGRKIFRSSQKISSVKTDKSCRLLAIGKVFLDFIVYDRLQDKILKPSPTNHNEAVNHTSDCYVTTFLWKQLNYKKYLICGYKCGIVTCYLVDTDKNILKLAKLFPFLKRNLEFLCFGEKDQLVAVNDIGQMFVVDTELEMDVTRRVEEEDEEEEEEHFVREVQAHNCVIKHVSCCPWQRKILATCGYQEKCLKFWNSTNLKMMQQHFFQEKITCSVWSEKTREIITGHCGPENQVIIWQYPSMKVVYRFMGHLKSVLSLQLGMGDTLLASLGFDETLLMWRCFGKYTYKDGKWVYINHMDAENKEDDEKEKENKEKDEFENFKIIYNKLKNHSDSPLSVNIR